MRVVLVDDQKLVRQGFRLILAVEPDITVVGEATNGAEGVDVLKETAPDVVLMDVQMPVMDGVAATAKIREFSDVKVVILTTFDRDDYLFDALDAGASGFMLKNAEAESLVAGLRQVADGHALLAPEVTRRVIAPVGASGEHGDRQQGRAAHRPRDRGGQIGGSGPVQC